MATEKVERISSCRGVSFEMKQQSDYQFLSNVTNFSSQRYWPPWRMNSRINATVVQGDIMQRSLSRTSSHFCDIYIPEDDEERENLADIEEGLHQVQDLEPSEQIPLPSVKASGQTEKSQPQKANYQSRLSVILFDQGLFTVYKRLFVVCLAINVTGLILSSTGHFEFAKNRAALFSIANIFALTLCRSEAFLRIIFWLVVKALGHSWVPIRIKTMATSFLQSLGGIHSGCGISSIIWLAYALSFTLKESKTTNGSRQPEIITVSSAILTLISLSSSAAFPVIRHLHHNVFERTHRFAGWSALLLLWAFIFLTTSYDPETRSYRITIILLIKVPEFWLTVGITVLIIIPWLTIRRVPVKISSSPSGHASIIKFQTGGVKPGLLGRISPSPLSEWHAFGIISDGKIDHMMLAGAVGDFTKSLISNPPTELWVRKLHFAGLPYLVNLYDRVLLVATGSGICVFLSFLLQPCPASVCLLWVTKGVEQNFGKKIKNWVNEPYFGDKAVIIHDTIVLGRPNVSQLSVETAKKWKAEAVIVTSNPAGSRDVVKACKEAGIPAFGPIWDS